MPETTEYGGVTFIYETTEKDYDSWPNSHRFESHWSGAHDQPVYRGTAQWVARMEKVFAEASPEYDFFATNPLFDKEVRVTDPETGGMKGQKDVRIHAIPWEALAPLGRVYTFGESKYDDYNFRKGYRWSLSFDALQRHLWAWWSREDSDSESGLLHLAHAAWHALTLLFFSVTGRGTDDRPT